MAVDGLLQNPQPAGLPAQVADQAVVGDAVEPGAGIVRKALGRPRRERGQQRALHRVLDDVEMPHADLARQHGDQPAVFVPEEMLDQPGAAVAPGRPSGLGRVKGPPPRGSRCSIPASASGISLATSIARSMLSAETNM